MQQVHIAHLSAAGGISALGRGAWLLLGPLRPSREATKPCGATVTQSRTSRLPPVH